MSGVPPRAPRPPWRTPGTRWRLRGDRQADRVYVVARWLPAKRRVRCTVEGESVGEGATRSFAESEFVGRASRLFEVGEQLALDKTRGTA